MIIFFLADGGLAEMVPPVMHGEPVRKTGRVLGFRDWMNAVEPRSCSCMCMSTMQMHEGWPGYARPSTIFSTTSLEY